jgi:hypothetical protein
VVEGTNWTFVSLRHEIFVSEMRSEEGQQQKFNQWPMKGGPQRRGWPLKNKSEPNSSILMNHQVSPCSIRPASGQRIDRSIDGHLPTY